MFSLTRTPAGADQRRRRERARQCQGQPAHPAAGQTDPRPRCARPRSRPAVRDPQRRGFVRVESPADRAANKPLVLFFVPDGKETAMSVIDGKVDRKKDEKKPKKANK